ncbi:zf-HC2 domain-containing protein [Actinoplanes sp. G11-F43]|uniref:zf-HC2 domain-containing protein n=1 Tax=Actinoplanes sp. G11-F43 TaxID=3424130 RepID=UPI003D334838
MTTHVSNGSLTAYAGGDLDEVTAWAVEAHLESCPDCLARLTDAAPADLRDLLDGAKQRIDTGVLDGPVPVRRSRWRRLAWHGASWSLPPVAAVTVLAVAAAFLLERVFPNRPSLVLLFAPVAPLAGLGFAWSRHSDRSWEVVAGTARAGLELLLRRTVAVLLGVLPPLAVAGWSLDREPALWLLPCLTFTAATVLLGSLIGVSRAAAVLGGGWLLAVAAPAVAAAATPVLLQPASTPGWAIAALIITALVPLRSGALARVDSWN